MVQHLDAPVKIRADLAALEGAVQERFPDLVLVARPDGVVAEGRVALFDAGRVADEYQVAVRLPPEHPAGYPVLFETGGRIPRVSDRHMEGNTGKCCVMAVDELHFRYPGGCDLLTVLSEPVTAFLISQTYYEAHDGWPFDAREHGLDGRLGFYAEQVGAKDTTVGLSVAMVVAGSSAGGGTKCPCGSGRPLRKCHRDVIRRLRDRIPQALVADLIREVRDGVGHPKSGTKLRRRWWPTK